MRHVADRPKRRVKRDRGAAWVAARWSGVTVADTDKGVPMETPHPHDRLENSVRRALLAIAAVATPLCFAATAHAEPDTTPTVPPVASPVEADDGDDGDNTGLWGLLGLLGLAGLAGLRRRQPDRSATYPTTGTTGGSTARNP